MLKVTAMILLLSVCTFTALLLADPADRAEGQYKAQLSGWQEVPPVVSPGSGEAVVEMEGSDSIKVTVKYQGVTGTPVLVALQLAQAGVIGAPVAFLCGGGANSKACPAAPAEISVTLKGADILASNPQGLEAGKLEPVLTALDHGLVYANVATAKFLQGEIRGQLVRGNRSDGNDNGKDKEKDKDDGASKP